MRRQRTGVHRVTCAALSITLVVFTEIRLPCFPKSNQQVTATQAAGQSYDARMKLSHKPDYVSTMIRDPEECFENFQRNTSLSDSCRTLINLSCPSRLRLGFYHRIMDCFVFEIGVLKREFRRGVCLLGFENRFELYQSVGLVVPAGYSSDFHFRERLTVPTCLRRSRNIIDIDYKRVPSVKDAVESVELINGLDYITLVTRLGTRDFDSSTLLELKTQLRLLAHQTGTKLAIYNGTESINRTVEIFRRSIAVLMFHGAAAANVIFCRRRAVLVEISTFQDLESKLRWRNNSWHVSRVRPDIRYIVKFVPLQLVYPNIDMKKLKESQETMLRTENVDHFIKDLRNVLLPHENIREIANEIRSHLEIHHI